MQTPQLRTLQAEDADALLAFEVDNRAWFEQFIDARPADFYSADGIRRHVATLLDGLAQGRWHPCLLLDETGRIVGRANLKDIDQRSGEAEVGYRIGQQASGRGYASAALAHLIGLAREQWRLRALNAYVTDHNPASARVLLRQGFVLQAQCPALATVAGQLYDGARYQLRLSA